MNYTFMNKVRYIVFKLGVFCKRIFIRVFGIKTKYQRFLRQDMPSDSEVTDWIKDRITSGEPLMICRYGSVEVSAVDAYLEKRFGFRKSYKDVVKRKMSNNAGFFSPTEELLDRFGSDMLAATSKIDLIGVWNLFEPYILKHFAPATVRYCRLGAICAKSGLPDQWTAALEGKKVLVIHPFEDSIRKQYARRELVFPNGFLPRFELNTIKAVQTQAGQADSRFANWFDALEYMKKQMDEIDYDVAIIGCGAYGMLLAEHAKNRGKQGIHLGGGTQMMFGVLGKRWENTTKYAVNEYWVRPSKEETPENANRIEGGCYW